MSLISDLLVAAVGGQSAVHGLIYFEQNTPCVPINVSWHIWGQAPNSLRGFHVHAFGDESDGCVSAGPHFNPENVTHGAPEDEIRHYGDLGNIKTDANGVATGWVTDEYLTLFGENSILGRSVVVHNGTDDLGRGGNAESLRSGNAGARNACGVIGYASK